MIYVIAPIEAEILNPQQSPTAGSLPINRFGSLYNKCHIDRGLLVFYSHHNQKRHVSRLWVSFGIVWAMNGCLISQPINKTYE